MNRRPSAQRLSEIGDFLAPNNARKSRLESSKVSFIPRPSGRSLERVSGVQPLENGSFQVLHATGAPGSRHRSADSARMTQIHGRPRAESAQRPTSHSRPRSTYLAIRETPSQRTPLARQLLQTPMSAMTSRQRTPSTERHRGRLTSVERAILAMPGKDNRMITDQTWLRRTSERVVDYLRQLPTACTLLPNDKAPLRPITIGLFVNLVNCLLGLPNHVNTSNYVQKLPTTARKILYPGVMTKSCLKSINAMHTYPNMLAFLSYLVDYSRVRDVIASRMTLSKISGEEKKGQVATLRQQYFLECWESFQNPTEPDFEPHLNAYIAALKEIHGISDHELSQLREKITDIKFEAGNPKLVEGRNYEAALKAQPAVLEEKARHLQQTRADLERALKQEMLQRTAYRDQVERAKDKTHHMESQIQELEKMLSKQQMTIRQRAEILSETDRILTAVDSKRKLVEEVQKMGFTKDLELGQLQKEALIASITLNRSLVAVGLAAGVNLNDYTIEERDLLAGNALEKNVAKIDKILSSIKSTAEEKLQQARHNKEAGVCRMQQVKIELESERQQKHKLCDELLALEEQSAEAKSQAAQQVAKQRSAAQAARQRTAELKRRTQEMLKEAHSELEYWQNQDKQWSSKLEQLRGEEELVRKTCEARAKALVGRYVAMAKSAVNKIPRDHS